MPLGRVDITHLTGVLQSSWQATKFSRMFERAFARRATTDDSQSEVTTQAAKLGAAIGMDRRLERHKFVFEIGGSFVHVDKHDPFLRQMGSRRDNQLNPRGGVVWQYDINKHWSSNLDGGLVYLNPRRTSSVRADQGDLAPIGAEPVVVDPAELLEGAGEDR